MTTKQKQRALSCAGWKQDGETLVRELRLNGYLYILTVSHDKSGWSWCLECKGAIEFSRKRFKRILHAMQAGMKFAYGELEMAEFAYSMPERQAYDEPDRVLPDVSRIEAWGYLNAFELN